MKIELSPWTVAETSARLPRKRRRTHDEQPDNGASGKAQAAKHPPPLDCDVDAGVSAALLGEYRGARSTSSPSWDPVVSLTLAHRVLLLGLVPRDGGLALEADRQGHYVTRPSPSASFLPSSTAATTSGSLTPVMPSIPCLCEGGRRLYAFLEGNHRLVSWKADQAVEEGVGAVLPSPALSLAACQQDDNLVFGSCEDGTLYLGRLSPTDGKKLEIDFLDSGVPSTFRHVATFSDASNARGKRAHKRKTAHIFQVYADGFRLLIYRHTPSPKPESSRPYTSKCLQCNLDPTGAASRSALRFVGRCRDEMVLSYGAGGTLFLCRVSLSQARVIGTVPLPCRASDATGLHIGLAGSVAVILGLRSQIPASDDGSRSVCLVDAHRGGIVSVQPLGFEFDRVLSLLTDGTDRVALVVARNDELCVGIATVRVTAPRDEVLRSRPITLAEGLSASCGSSRPNGHGAASLDSVASESRESRAVSLLSDAKHAIERNTLKSRRKGFLSGVYEQAILLLNHGETGPEHLAIDAGSANNPQEPSEQQNGANGKKRKSPSKPSALAQSEAINGTHPPAQSPVAKIEPRMLPAAFVDPASCLTIEILLIPKLPDGTRNEARVMLRRFVRTGKVSARRAITRLHEVFNALERVSDSEKPAYSPVDLMFDVFRCCKDVSEHQVVTSVRYLLSVASIRDISSHLRRNKKQLRLNETLVSTLNDWDRLDISPSRSDEEELSYSSASAKIALAAAKALVSVITLYSKFNEVLLRNAVKTLLSREEAGLMCRLLSDSLTSEAIASAAGRKALMQWVAVTTEQLHRSSDGWAEDVAYARKTAASHARTSEGILAVQNLVAASVDSAKRSLIAAKASIASKKETAVSPSYQIERLVL